MQTEQETIEKYELVTGNWYNILLQARERKGRVGRASDLIRAKNSLPFEHEFWQNGAYVSTTLDHAQENPVLLIKDNSDLLKLKNAEKAVQLHSQGEEVYITKTKYNAHLKQAEKEAKKAPEKRGIFIFPERLSPEI